MSDCVTRRIVRVEARFRDTEFKKHLDSFKFESLVRNLTHKTLDGYFERLGYLFAYLQEAKLGFESVDRKVIQDYVLSLKGHVSDETVNGRIRAYKRFFNFLTAEGLWEGENPTNGIEPLRTSMRASNGQSWNGHETRTKQHPNSE